MNINKELIFKESLPFFKNLSKEEKNILYDASHIEEYKAGELIYSKYKSCTGLVLSQMVSLEVLCHHYQERKSRFLNYLKMIYVYYHHLAFIKTYPMI